MNAISRIFVGLMLASAGIGLSVVGAFTAYAGYDRALDIPFIGWIGPCFAGAACFGGSAVILLRRDEQHRLAAFAIAATAVAFCFDFAGNALALVGEVQTAEQVSADRNAEFSTAAESLPDVKKNIAKYERQQEVISGADIFAAQRLLKTVKKYSGEIDGKPGGKTQEAMEAYGGWLVDELGRLETRKTELENKKAAGGAVSDGVMNLWWALALALALTAMAAALTSIGIPLMAEAFQRRVDPQKQVNEVQAKLGEISSIIGFRKAA
jgi:hypothetical protein